MRTELEAISVKIDKVPTLVDKIVKEAGKDNEKNDETSQLSIQIESSYSSLSEKIKLIEELIIQPLSFQNLIKKTVVWKKKLIL